MRPSAGQTVSGGGLQNRPDASLLAEHSRFRPTASCLLRGIGYSLDTFEGIEVHQPLAGGNQIHGEHEIARVARFQGDVTAGEGQILARAGREPAGRGLFATVRPITA